MIRIREYGLQPRGSGGRIDLVIHGQQGAVRQLLRLIAIIGLDGEASLLAEA